MNVMTEKEEWKEIPDSKGYLASSLGRIKSPRGIVLKPYTHTAKGGKEYLRIHLGDKKRRQGVHRIVCLTFHGEPPEPKMEAGHKDDDGFNNRSDNLIWVTRSENMKMSWENRGHIRKLKECGNCSCLEDTHDEHGVCRTEGCMCKGWEKKK